VRFDVYDWPETPGQQPPLVSEFTYTNVTLNVDLDDATFAPARLRGR
jgi:outer membrane lipoprotein-sorting protein